MPVSFLPFGAYRGPAGSKYGDGLAQADNVLPIFTDLYPVRGKTLPVYATAAGYGPVTGGHIHIWPVSPGTASYEGDAATIFVGSKTRLTTANAGAFTDLSRAALYAQAAGDEPSGWHFASYGNHVYATNYVDEIQKRTNNAGIFANSPTSTLVPEARFIATVREFMFAADIHNAGYFADQVLWSDIDDADWWDPANAARDTSVAGQKRILSRPGQITGLVGGAYATIFKRNSIHVMQFVGGDDIWRLDELAVGTGTSYPGSIIDAPTGIYFFDGKSFRVMRGLAAPEKISPPEIDQLLIDNCHNPTRTIVHGLPTTLILEEAVMRGWYGDRTGCIYWTWANTTVDGGTVGPYAHDRGLVYNPETGAWSALFSTGLNLTLGLSRAPTVLSIAADFSIDRTEFFDWDGTNTSWFRLEDNNLPATLRTKRQPIAMDGAGVGYPHRVRLKAVLPVFTVPDNGRSFTASPSMPTVPDVTVTVTTANEPHHAPQSDGLSTVSPRSEALLRSTSAVDSGWMACTLEGAWWDFKVEIPAAEWASFSGLYLDYEPL